MKIEIKQKYLIFPVNTLVSYKKMMISCDEETDYTLNICLDNLSPNFYAYVDVSQYMGKAISVSIDPEMENYVDHRLHGKKYRDSFFKIYLGELV